MSMPGSRQAHAVPMYEIASFDTYPWIADIDSAGESYFIEVVYKIVRAEGPVHVDVVKRRIAEHFDEWLTKKLSGQLDEYISRVVWSGSIKRHGEFLWSARSQSVSVRDRSDLPKNIRKIEYVAAEELAAAIEMVVRHSHGIESDEAIMETARLLGFERVTDGVEARIGEVLSEMVNGGDLVWRNGHLVVVE